MEDVRVYSKVGCKYCDMAKCLLTQIQVPFSETRLDPSDLAKYQSETRALVSRTGHRTFPQIFSGETFVGGYDDLERLVQKSCYGLVDDF